MVKTLKGIDRALALRNQLGARLRVLRLARKDTQQVIADRIGASPKYISQLECGQGSPSWEALVTIAHYGFEITLPSLMFGVDEAIGIEVQELSDLLAGRSKEARRDLLRAMELTLRAGAGSAPLAPPGRSGSSRR